MIFFVMYIDFCSDSIVRVRNIGQWRWSLLPVPNYITSSAKWFDRRVQRSQQCMYLILNVYFKKTSCIAIVTLNYLQ